MARRTIWLAACAAIAGAAACQAAPPSGRPEPIARQGKTEVAARWDGVAASANLLTHEVSIGTANEQPPRRRTSNCTFSHVSCLLLDSLEISVDGRPIIVPRSAFGDLSDVSTAALHRTARGRFGLILRGGDASEAYEAEILFDRHRVLERIVTDGEAQAIAEKTTYFDLSRSFR